MSCFGVLFSSITDVVAEWPKAYACYFHLGIAVSVYLFGGAGSNPADVDQLAFRPSLFAFFGLDILKSMQYSCRDAPRLSGCYLPIDVQRAGG